LEIHPRDVEINGEPYCPHCKTWTDVGPEFSDDGTLQRWDCGVCNAGPEAWHADPVAAEKSWEEWVAAHAD